MRVELITSDHGFAALQTEWNAFLRRSAADSVFLTWEWLSAWRDSYGADKALRVLVARDEDGSCQGIAPLCVERCRRFGRTLRRLCFLGDGSYDSDYLDFILAPGREGDVLEAFLDRLSALKDQWDVMQLNEIPDSSATVELFAALSQERGWLLRQEEVPCGFMSLPDTWELYLSTLRQRFRTSIRACLRNLERWDGGFECLREQAAIEPWLEQLFALHSGRWGLRDQQGVFKHSAKREFYRRMARSFAACGWLHVTRWRVRGTVLACQFGFVYRGTYHLLQEGFDAECTHVSPGITLRAATIRDLIARGVRAYDFLGGLGRHKTDWGAQAKTSVRLSVAPPTAAGFAYVQFPAHVNRAKVWIKRFLPEPVLRWRQRGRSGRPAAEGKLTEPAPPTGSILATPWRARLAVALRRSGALHIARYLSRRIELRRVPTPLRVGCRRALDPRFAVLCYHRVGRGGIPFYSSLAPEIFEEQMRYLRRHYRIVPLDTLYCELETPRSNEPAAVVTFDDGYRDLYTYAFPILRRYQIPATIYLTAASVDTGEVAWYDRVFLALQVASTEKLDLLLDRPRRFLLSSSAARLRAAEETISWLRTLPNDLRQEHCAQFERQFPLPADELKNRMLTWDQVRTMEAAGIRFGSHTLTHPVISRLGHAELERELIESKRMIEGQIGHAVLDFAYPFGKAADYGDAAPIVARCGYRSAATTIWGLNRPGINLHELRRVSVGEAQSLSMFAFGLAKLFLFDEENPVRKVKEDASSAKQRSACDLA